MRDKPTKKNRNSFFSNVNTLTGHFFDIKNSETDENLVNFSKSLRGDMMNWQIIQEISFEPGLEHNDIN